MSCSTCTLQKNMANPNHLQVTAALNPAQDDRPEETNELREFYEKLCRTLRLI